VTVLYVRKLTMELHDHTHKRAKDNDSGGFEACLGPEFDGKGDGLHGVGMAPDEEAPKQDPRQPIPLGIQVSQVTDVVGHHPTQALRMKMMKWMKRNAEHVRHTEASCYCVTMQTQLEMRNMSSMHMDEISLARMEECGQGFWRWCL